MNAYALPCITELQPQASLLSMGELTILIRSRRINPSLIGARVGIHASKRPPAANRMNQWEFEPNHDRSWVTWRKNDSSGIQDLPLGSIVGSARLEACVPIYRKELLPKSNKNGLEGCVVYSNSTDEITYNEPVEPIGGILPTLGTSILNGDQVPSYGLMAGNYALVFNYVEPITKKCPWCSIHYGENRCGCGPGVRHIADCGRPAPPCPVCKGAGWCNPIPARGYSHLWWWRPSSFLML